jgi:hypothetical protein
MRNGTEIKYNANSLLPGKKCSMSLTSGPKYVNLPYLYSNSAIENHRIVVIRATIFLEDVPQ